MTRVARCSPAPCSARRPPRQRRWHACLPKGAPVRLGPGCSDQLLRQSSMKASPSDQRLARRDHASVREGCTIGTRCMWYGRLRVRAPRLRGGQRCPMFYDPARTSRDTGPTPSTLTATSASTSPWRATTPSACPPVQPRIGYRGPRFRRPGVAWRMRHNHPPRHSPRRRLHRGGGGGRYPGCGSQVVRSRRSRSSVRPRLGVTGGASLHRRLRRLPHGDPTEHALVAARAGTPVLLEHALSELGYLTQIADLYLDEIEAMTSASAGTSAALGGP